MADELADAVQLFGEIKIHQAMLHPNIIKFDECYEDDGNVYMELKLCANGVSRSSTAGRN